MRRLPLLLPLLTLAFAGCKTPGNKPLEQEAAPVKVAAATPSASRAPRPTWIEPAPPPPPPAALAVVRSVSPEPTVVADSAASFALEQEVAAALPPPNLPRPLQSCPVDPLLSVLAGSKDPQTHQDALSVIGLMLATGTARALHGSGSGGHHNHVAGNIDDVLQTDDDQSAVSKQMRPPVLFTLGWKY